MQGPPCRGCPPILSSPPTRGCRALPAGGLGVSPNYLPYSPSKGCRALPAGVWGCPPTLSQGVQAPPAGGLGVSPSLSLTSTKGVQGAPCVIITLEKTIV